MRIDAAPAATPFGDDDPVNRLRRSVSAVRRRWYLVIVPLVVGAVMGWFSTPQEVQVSDLGIPVPTTRYYQAAHVLIAETPDGSTAEGGPAVNLSQAAYLVNTGEVPVRVAERLGISVDDVEDSLLGLPRLEVQSVEVQAVGTDEEQLVELADAAAAELLVTLQAQAERDANAARDQILAQLDELDVQIDELTTELAGNPPNRPQLEAQQRSATNQYSLVYEEFSQLANLPAPTAGLTSLEGAKAQRIPKEDYERTLTDIREGAGYVTGAATTVPEETDGLEEEPSPGASRTARTVVGGIVGLALGLGLVLLLDRFDRRLRRRQDVEAATGLPVVAEIPPLTRHEQRALEVVAHTQHRSHAAEAYRVVRGAVMLQLATTQSPSPDDAVVIMVTSSNPGEGKTTTVANLAAVLAEGRLTVLVVNCDFRRPRVHDYLLHSQGGQAIARNGEVTQLGSVVVTATEIDKVRLITGIGEDDPNANPLDVVAIQRKVIGMARSRFDVIVLDTAPFLATNDASELLPEIDQLLLVVRADKTTAESASRTAELLARFHAPVLGVVLNDAEDPGAQYHAAYGYTGPRRSTGREVRPDTGADKRRRNDTAADGGRLGDSVPSATGAPDGV